MNKHQPSLLAAASIYVGKRISDHEVCWSAFMEKETGYRLSEVKLCSRDICNLLSSAATKKSFKAVFKKFSTVR